MISLLVFLVCLCVPSGSGQDPPFEEENAMASVREYPTLLHKCTASFITPDVLITTARCLFCGEECSLFVQVLSDNLMGNDKNKAVNVSSIAVNPLYDRVEGMNDVGLIRLKEKVNEAKVFSLPTELNIASGFEVATFTWKFTNNLQDYYLTKKTRNIMSTATCSLVLKRYVGYREICTWGKESISAGPDDQGSPLISVKDSDKVLLGIYAKEGSAHPSKLEVFEALYPSVEWIKQILNCDGNCSHEFSIAKKPSENPLNTETPVAHTATPNLDNSTVKQTARKSQTRDKEEVLDTSGAQPKGTTNSLYRTETIPVSFKTTNTSPDVTTVPIKTPDSTNAAENIPATENPSNADAVDENDDGVPYELSALLA